VYFEQVSYAYRLHGSNADVLDCKCFRLLEMQRQHGMITAADLASIYRLVSVRTTLLLVPACGHTFLRSPGELRCSTRLCVHNVPIRNETVAFRSSLLQV